MTLDLDALEQALAAGTPGPWEARTEIGHPGVIAVKTPGAFDWICSMQVSNSPGYAADATLIVTAVNALPALVARCRELEAGIESIYAGLDYDLRQGDQPKSANMKAWQTANTLRRKGEL